MISDSAFIPPSFDLSYHLKGKSKPKAQEKYNTADYLVTGRAGVPNVPSAQATVFLPEEGVPTTKYQESPTESPIVTQTDIQVDKLGFNVELSYDVVLSQEPQHDQVATPNAYPRSPMSYITCDSRSLSEDYYPPSIPTPNHRSHSATIPHTPADADWYPQPHLEDYSTAINGHLSPLVPQPFSGPHVQPEYLGRFHYQAPNHPSGPLGMPPQHGFVEVG